jgi:purine-binding chemotaxis protein CheW
MQQRAGSYFGRELFEGISKNMASTITDKRTEQEITSQGAMASIAGKYLTFRLDNEEYGIKILTVKEIIKLMEITAVPRTPEFVRGVINLRGKVIPVIELRTKFCMERTEDTDETCIIVVNVNHADLDLQMGILVDAVSEVLDIAGSEIEPAPRFGGSVSTDFILGMAKAKGSVKILLDIDKILTQNEMESVLQS